MKFFKTTFVFTYILSSYIQVAAQSADHSKLRDHITSTKLEELKAQLDYTKTKKIWSPRATNSEIKKKEIESRRVSPLAQIFGKLMYYVLLILVIMVVIGIIVFLFSNIKDDRSIEINTPTDVEEELKDIHEIDLDHMLSSALSNQNYRLAIRAQFLMILRSLSSGDLIDWSIEKTNRDYLREVRGQTFYPNFRYSAALFDRAWYSDEEVTQNHYAQAAPLFEDLKSFIIRKPYSDEGQ